MSFDFDADAKLNQYGGMYRVNSLERDKRSKEYVDRMAFSTLRDQLARHLSQDCMRVTENVYSTEYEIRVYVLTGDQLEKYVQRRVQRMGMGGPYAVHESDYVK